MRAGNETHARILRRPAGWQGVKLTLDRNDITNHPMRYEPGEEQNPLIDPHAPARLSALDREFECAWDSTVNSAQPWARAMCSTKPAQRATETASLRNRRQHIA